MKIFIKYLNHNKTNKENQNDVQVVFKSEL